MKKTYIMPVIGQVYTNRNGGQYRCINNMIYDSGKRAQEVVALGEHTATMERIKDGWTLVAHGISAYEDGTVEWIYSTCGHFRNGNQIRWAPEG